MTCCFIADGQLKHWHRNGDVETVFYENVVDYSLSADGQHAVVALNAVSPQIANTVTTVTQTLDASSLNYVNLVTGENYPLIPEIQHDSEIRFQLSQDGMHLVLSGLTIGNHKSSVTTDEKLYVVKVAAGSSPAEIYSCAGRCKNLLWHPDNHEFLFSDDNGLFLYDQISNESQSLIPAEPYQESYPLAWSKNGRWLLLQISVPNDTSHYVFDLPTKQLMVVPHTESYDGFPYADVVWTQDDRLFMMRSEKNWELGEIWRVNMNSNEIEREDSVVLSDTKAFVRPWQPVQWANGRFGYALLNMDENTTNLYRRHTLNDTPELLNVVPEARFPLHILWAPDDSEALLNVEDTIYYASAKGEVIKLETAVGQNAHRFTWLP